MDMPEAIPVNSADPTGTVKITCDSPASTEYDGSCNISNGLYGYYGAMGCGIDGSYGFQYDINSIVPCLFAAQAGGGGGGSGHAAPAQPPTPSCDVSLYSQNVFGSPFLHTFIEVDWTVGIDTFSQEFEGIPGPSSGHLLPTIQNAKDAPNGGSYYPGTSALLFDLSGNSTCSQATQIRRLAASFPNDAYTYFAPYNINSFSYSLLTYSNTPIPTSVNSYLNASVPGLVNGAGTGIQRAPAWGLLIPGWGPQ